jgi:glutathione synthase/RimK-type ligase-like ATP-grasp enzyme
MRVQQKALRADEPRASSLPADPPQSDSASEPDAEPFLFLFAERQPANHELSALVPRANIGQGQPGPTRGKSAVLIISAESDGHGDAVALGLAKRKVPVWHWNLERFPRTCPLSIHLDPNTDELVRGIVGTLDCDLPLEGVKSVWLRRNMSGLFAPRDRPDDIAVFVSLELEAAFRSLADVLRCAFWVNPPHALYAMESGITQLQAAVAAGLPVPHTLITTDTGRARDFYDAVGGRVVAKSFWAQVPLSSTDRLAIPASRVLPSHLEHIDRVRYSPCIFQEELLHEAEVRVLIIGRQIFAAERQSDGSCSEQDDRRRDPSKTEYRQCALPASVEASCLRLLEAWGLVFGAVDMIRRPDGEHVFLAFSANTEWLWLERATGQPITAAVVSLLERGDLTSHC